MYGIHYSNANLLINYLRTRNKIKEGLLSVNGGISMLFFYFEVVLLGITTDHQSTFKARIENISWVDQWKMCALQKIRNCLNNLSTKKVTLLANSLTKQLI